jgi:hypothetical protein
MSDSWANQHITISCSFESRSNKIRILWLLCVFFIVDLSVFEHSFHQRLKPIAIDPKAKILGGLGAAPHTEKYSLSSILLLSLTNTPFTLLKLGQNQSGIDQISKPV